MNHFKKLKLTIILSFMATLSSCNSKSNIFNYITPSDHKDSYDYKLTQAQAEYEKNNLEEALILAEEAYDFNPFAFDASILIAQINLSLAEGDPLQIVKQMAKGGKEEGEENNDKDSSIFDTIAEVINLDNAELEEISDIDTQDPELPILVPKCAELSRIESQRLTYIDNAIKVICPFITKEALNKSDFRQRCESVNYSHDGEPRANMIWAFAHLVEVLLFNNILSYSTTDSSKTNLELRVEALQKKENSTTDIAAFITEIESLDKIVDKVIPTTSLCSKEYPTTMLQATSYDLQAIQAAFIHLLGVPDSVIKSIDDLLLKLKSINGGSLSEIKNKMNKGIAENLASEIDKLGEDPSKQVTAEEKTKICDSYSSISGNSSEIPDLCK